MDAITPGKKFKKADSISKLIKEILVTLEEEKYIELSFEDFAQYVPSYFGEEVISKDIIKTISKLLKYNSLDSEPRIRQGFINHKAFSPIFIYKKIGSIDTSSDNYKHGLLMVRIAVIMTKADGSIDDHERKSIEKLIWNMGFLSETERVSLYVKASYFMATDRIYDKQARQHIKIILNQSGFIEKLEELNTSSQNTLLKVAKDIAIADGFLEKGELTLLQDMYRVMGLSARSAKTDLERHAAKEYIDLKSKTSFNNIEAISDTEFEDFDDVLGDLLMEFDDF